MLFFGAEGVLKKDGHLCKLIVLELLDQCFGNFLLHQSKVVCIHNRFSPYNPDNMVRTSPHTFRRPWGIIIKVFFLSSNFLLNCQISNSMYRRLGVMLHCYYFSRHFSVFCSSALVFLEIQFHQYSRLEQQSKKSMQWHEIVDQFYLQVFQ